MFGSTAKELEKAFDGLTEGRKAMKPIYTTTMPASGNFIAVYQSGRVKAENLRRNQEGLEFERSPREWYPEDPEYYEGAIFITALEESEQ